MDSGDWQHLIVAIVALVIMSMAALVQSVIGLTSAQRLRQATGEATAKQRTVQTLVDPRRALSASMLLVQVIAAVVASVELAYTLNQASDINLSWLAILIVALVYLVFGQAMPRALAQKDLGTILNGVLRVAQIVTVLLVPLTWLVERLATVFVDLLPGRTFAPESHRLEDEMRPRRHEADDGVIDDDEQEMIDGILSLEEMTARDIMVPRLDIIAVERTINPRELIDTITRAGHSRIPVYQESIDRVLGVLYVKDLLSFVIGSTNRIPLLDIIRPAFVVPESKKLSELFTELKRTKIHIAIVADEYGGTAGLVTIEDILEEIVGEIQDEYDIEEPLFEQLSDDVLMADGRLPIEDVEDALRIQFEEDDDFGTLGGFVHKHLGRLPIQGDVFEAENVRVEILSVERHRVRRLRLTKLPPVASDTGDERSESGDDADRASGDSAS